MQCLLVLVSVPTPDTAIILSFVPESGILATSPKKPWLGRKPVTHVSHITGEKVRLGSVLVALEWGAFCILPATEADIAVVIQGNKKKGETFFTSLQAFPPP